MQKVKDWKKQFHTVVKVDKEQPLTRGGYWIKHNPPTVPIEGESGDNKKDSK